MSEDLEHLRLLSIFHYVVGGLAGLCACFPVIHVFMGIAIITGAFDRPKGPPEPAFFGWIFVFVGAGAMILGWAFAICMLIAGRLLTRRRGYVFCMVIAAIGCNFMPFGTVLGIFTIIVLARPSVRELFARSVLPVEELL